MKKRKRKQSLVSNGFTVTDTSPSTNGSIKSTVDNSTDSNNNGSNCTNGVDSLSNDNNSTHLNKTNSNSTKPRIISKPNSMKQAKPTSHKDNLRAIAKQLLPHRESLPIYSGKRKLLFIVIAKSEKFLF